MYAQDTRIYPRLPFIVDIDDELRVLAAKVDAYARRTHTQHNHKAAARTITATPAPPGEGPLTRARGEQSASIGADSVISAGSVGGVGSAASNADLLLANPLADISSSSSSSPPHPPSALPPSASAFSASVKKISYIARLTATLLSGILAYPLYLFSIFCTLLFSLVLNTAARLLPSSRWFTPSELFHAYTYRYLSKDHSIVYPYLKPLILALHRRLFLRNDPEIHALNRQKQEVPESGGAYRMEVADGDGATQHSDRVGTIDGTNVDRAVAPGVKASLVGNGSYIGGVDGVDGAGVADGGNDGDNPDGREGMHNESEVSEEKEEGAQVQDEMGKTPLISKERVPVICKQDTCRKTDETPNSQLGKWISPNLVTIFGMGWVVSQALTSYLATEYLFPENTSAGNSGTLHYSYTFRMALVAIAIFQALYFTFDALDGIQGVRVGTYGDLWCCPTTELFDHALDSFATTSMCIAMIPVLGILRPEKLAIISQKWDAFSQSTGFSFDFINIPFLGIPISSLFPNAYFPEHIAPLFLWIIVFSTQMNFALATWQNAVLKKMTFPGGLSNPTEVNCTVVCFFLLLAWKPDVHFCTLSDLYSTLLIGSANVFSGIRHVSKFITIPEPPWAHLIKPSSSIPITTASIAYDLGMSSWIQKQFPILFPSAFSWYSAHKSMLSGILTLLTSVPIIYLCIILSFFLTLTSIMSALYDTYTSLTSYTRDHYIDEQLRGVLTIIKEKSLEKESKSAGNIAHKLGHNGLQRDEGIFHHAANNPCVFAICTCSFLSMHGPLASTHDNVQPFTENSLYEEAKDGDMREMYRNHREYNDNDMKIDEYRQDNEDARFPQLPPHRTSEGIHLGTGTGVGKTRKPQNRGRNAGRATVAIPAPASNTLFANFSPYNNDDDASDDNDMYDAAKDWISEGYGSNDTVGDVSSRNAKNEDTPPSRLASYACVLHHPLFSQYLSTAAIGANDVGGGSAGAGGSSSGVREQSHAAQAPQRKVGSGKMATTPSVEHCSPLLQLITLQNHPKLKKDPTTFSTACYGLVPILVSSFLGLIYVMKMPVWYLHTYPRLMTASIALPFLPHVLMYIVMETTHAKPKMKVLWFATVIPLLLVLLSVFSSNYTHLHPGQHTLHPLTSETSLFNPELFQKYPIPDADTSTLPPFAFRAHQAWQRTHTPQHTPTCALKPNVPIATIKFHKRAITPHAPAADRITTPSPTVIATPHAPAVLTKRNTQPEKDLGTTSAAIDSPARGETTKECAENGVVGRNTDRMYGLRHTTRSAKVMMAELRRMATQLQEKASYVQEKARQTRMFTYLHRVLRQCAAVCLKNPLLLVHYTAALLTCLDFALFVYLFVCFSRELCYILGIPHPFAIPARAHALLIAKHMHNPHQYLSAAYAVCSCVQTESHTGVDNSDYSPHVGKLDHDVLPARDGVCRHEEDIDVNEGPNVGPDRGTSTSMGTGIGTAMGMGTNSVSGSEDESVSDELTEEKVHSDRGAVEDARVESTAHDGSGAGNGDEGEATASEVNDAGHAASRNGEQWQHHLARARRVVESWERQWTGASDIDHHTARGGGSSAIRGDLRDKHDMSSDIRGEGDTYGKSNDIDGLLPSITGTSTSIGTSAGSLFSTGASTGIGTTPPTPSDSSVGTNTVPRPAPAGTAAHEGHSACASHGRNREDGACRREGDLDVNEGANASSGMGNDGKGLGRTE